MNKFPDFISIVIPSYNEEKRLSPSVEALSRFCEENFEKYEIIFVDDGSTDQTWEILKNLSSGPLQALHLDQNRGKGYAVKQGMLRADGQYRFFTDADLPYELSSFLSAMEVFHSSTCDMVIGGRDLPESCDRAGLSRGRRIAGKTFSAIVNFLMKIDIKDTQCGFKAFTGDAAHKIFTKSTLNGYTFDVEIFRLAKHLNLKIQKIPVTLVQKQLSKIRLVKDAFFMLADVMKLYSRQRT